MCVWGGGLLCPLCKTGTHSFCKTQAFAVDIDGGSERVLTGSPDTQVLSAPFPAYPHDPLQRSATPPTRSPILQNENVQETCTLTYKKQYSEGLPGAPQEVALLLTAKDVTDAEDEALVAPAATSMLHLKLGKTRDLPLPDGGVETQHVHVKLTHHKVSHKTSKKLAEEVEFGDELDFPFIKEYPLNITLSIDQCKNVCPVRCAPGPMPRAAPRLSSTCRPLSPHVPPHGLSP